MRISLRHFFTCFALLGTIALAPLHAAAAQDGSAAIDLRVSVVSGHGDKSVCPGSSSLQISDGAPVTWCYTVTNIGSAAVTDATITDANVDITFISFEELQPGESETYFHNTTAAAGLASSGTVTVQSANGPVSASGTATITKPPPPTTTTAPPVTTAPATTAPTTTAPATTAPTNTAPTTTAPTTTGVLETTLGEATPTTTTLTTPETTPDAIAFADEAASSNLFGYIIAAGLLMIGLPLMAVGAKRERLNQPK